MDSNQSSQVSASPQKRTKNFFDFIAFFLLFLSVIDLALLVFGKSQGPFWSLLVLWPGSAISFLLARAYGKGVGGEATRRFFTIIGIPLLILLALYVMMRIFSPDYFQGLLSN